MGASNSPQTAGRSWKSVLGGVLTACLLAPVPVFAINFSGVSWTISQPGSSALFTKIDQSSDATDSLLTFYLAGPNQTTLASGISTVTATITAGSSDTLKSTWANLNNMNVTGGSVAVSITVTNGTPSGTGNMFSPPAYTTANEPTSSPTTTNVGSFTANPVVTVKFDYSSFVDVQTTSSTTFTLDFHN